MKNSALSFRRWAVILAAALSGIIVLVSMFADPVPGAEGRELIQGYAANEGRQGSVSYTHLTLPTTPYV